MNEQNEKNVENDIYARKAPKKLAIITATVLVAILILNVALTLIGDKLMWYVDLSLSSYISADTKMYTLSEECVDLFASQAKPAIESINKDREARGEEKIKVNIVFCTERDYIESDSLMRYVSYTARSLACEFPELVEVTYINMTQNPSAVQKYKTTSAATINDSDIIVEFGTESLVQSVSSFYETEATATQPWAYNGEKRFMATILAVTRAEAPICCLTTNHGESLFDANGEVKDEYTTFIKLIKGAGYDVRFIDLEKDEIPEKCRLIITFDPSSDFKAFGNLGENNVSEIEKLEEFIGEVNTFFYVCDSDTPYLKNLEEYLEEWGIAVGRAEDKAHNMHNYLLKDTVNCTDAGTGKVIVGNYATEGLGSTVTRDMQNRSYPPKVIFGNSTAIVPSANYNKIYSTPDEDAGEEQFVYYYYFKNGTSRSMLDVFTSSNLASAMVGSEVYEIATEQNRFKLMTITQEEHNVQVNNYSSVDFASYVIALSSTDFLKNDVLNSTAYGNTDVILSTLKNTSHEVVPTSVEIKGLYKYSVEDEFAYKSVNTTAWIASLSLIPFVLVLGTGSVICIRRKYK